MVNYVGRSEDVHGLEV